MEQLKALYETYFAAAQKVWKERPAWDGMLGLGASIKDHPCHMAFYKSVEQWVADFLQAPSEAAAEEAITYIMQIPESHKGQFTYWTLLAAQGLARPLVPLISPDHAGRMRAWYEGVYPRQARMPVHKELLKLLKKRERE